MSLTDKQSLQVLLDSDTFAGYAWSAIKVDYPLIQTRTTKLKAKDSIKNVITVMNFKVAKLRALPKKGIIQSIVTPMTARIVLRQSLLMQIKEQCPAKSLLKVTANTIAITVSVKYT